MTSLSLTERRLAILLSASSRDCSKAEVEVLDCSRMDREEEDSKREEEEVEAGRLQLVLSGSSRGCRTGASFVTSSLLAYLAFNKHHSEGINWLDCQQIFMFKSS